MTPSAALAGLVAGVGPLADVPGVDQLRALGTVPQRDRLVTCVDAALGVSKMSDLAELMPSLRIATSPDNGVSLIGRAAHHQLSVLGVTPERLGEAGGTFLYSDRPHPAIDALRDDAANVLIHEAIMLPNWQRITEQREVTYLDVGPAVVKAFAEWRWPTATVPSGYLPTLGRDLTALEFADFPLLCRADVPDDIASMIAWCMVETRAVIEGQYRHLPPERSQITYPLESKAIATTPIPLHPAAEATYAALEDDVQEGAVRHDPAGWSFPGGLENTPTVRETVDDGRAPEVPRRKSCHVMPAGREFTVDSMPNLWISGAADHILLQVIGDDARAVIVPTYEIKG
jgi:TRAP-type uncharacterized transport system substrate-binding protein